MEFSFTDDQKIFRQDIKSFIEQELTPEMLEEPGEVAGVKYSKKFSKKLGDKGWIGLAWPKEYGGQGLDQIDQMIYLEEMITNAAPIGYHYTAERQMIPSIIISGTEEQKQWFIPRVAKGELAMSIGYSEPETGSDLASIQTRAIPNGNDYIINGSKIWNGAHNTEWMWLATRTKTDGPSHKGISVFLVDLTLPGIQIEPFENMANEKNFAIVTFEDVRVPKRMMVGEENRGWYVVMVNLDFERSGIERVAVNYPILREFVNYLKITPRHGSILWDDPIIRNKVAEMFVEVEVGRLLSYKIAWMQNRGIIPNKEATISKVFGAQITQRNGRKMMEILGMNGLLEMDPKYAPLKGKILKAWYDSYSTTITGGTSEIMRNVIALRGLGLPRGN